MTSKMAAASLLLLLLAALQVVVSGSRPSHRRASKFLTWDSDGNRNLHEGPYPHSYLAPPPRQDRKLVFINNKAYDLTEAEESRVWELYLKEGHVPSQTHNWKSSAHLDSLDAALMVPVAAQQDLDTTHRTPEDEGNSQRPPEEPYSKHHESDNGPQMPPKTEDNSIKKPQENKTKQELPEDNPNVESPSEEDGSFKQNNQSANLKMSRFVADPSKFNLIKKVEDEELEELYATTAAPSNLADEKETTEVHFEATEVNPLSFIWTELLNLGELLGRELIDTVSGKLMYLWNSFVTFVKARGRRALEGQSWDL